MLTITVICMGSGRHLYRATALAPHQKLVAEATKKYQAEVKKAAAEANSPNAQKAVAGDAGETVFQTKCTACHAMDEKVVGPPVTEMVEIYKDNQVALQDWIRKPGKKRADAPQMPALGLSEQELKEVSEYILKQNKR